MFVKRYSVAILLLSIGKLVKAQSVDTSTVTITAAPQFSVEPACIQNCLFWSTGIIQEYLLSDLGCTKSQIYNQCYCTQDQDAKASSYLNYCIDELCVGTTLLPKAISVYESYCIGAGYPRVAAATQTTSSSATKSPSTQSSTQSSTATPGNSVSPSSAPSNTTPPSSSSSSSSSPNSPANSGNASSSSSSKSNTGPIVGGVVGGLGGAALVLGGIFLILRSHRKKHGKGENQGHYAEAGAAQSPPNEQDEKQVTPAVFPAKQALQSQRPVSPVSPILKPVEPVEPVKQLVGGRAELLEKQSEPAVSVMPAAAPNVTELHGEGRYGLRPDELDPNGNYIGELHGDGRQPGSTELP